MSFIYSRALVEESLQGRCLGTDASAQSSGSHTPSLFLPSDKMTAFSRLSRFGMTFKLLTANRGAELLTSWLAGFPAKTSAWPEKAQALPEPGAECGAKWRASLAKFDHASSSWKTVQLSLLGDSELSSVTWPRSGMTAGGQCLELPTLGRRTREIGSGLWPTPTCPRENDSDNTAGKYYQSKNQFDLAAAVHFMWPIPTVCGNYNRKGASATSGDGLATAVKAWATPVARDFRHPGRSRMERTGSTAGDPLPQQVGGVLNPTWVEWLMGWPLGWTDLKPLGMDKCHSAQQQRSGCLQHET